MVKKAAADLTLLTQSDSYSQGFLQHTSLLSAQGLGAGRPCAGPSGSLLPLFNGESNATFSVRPSLTTEFKTTILSTAW